MVAGWEMEARTRAYGWAGGPFHLRVRIGLLLPFLLLRLVGVGWWVFFGTNYSYTRTHACTHTIAASGFA